MGHIASLWTLLGETMKSSSAVFNMQFSWEMSNTVKFKTHCNTGVSRKVLFVWYISIEVDNAEQHFVVVKAVKQSSCTMFSYPAMALGVILLEWTDQATNNTSINTEVLWCLLNTNCMLFNYNSANANMKQKSFLRVQYYNKM